MTPSRSATSGRATACRTSRSRSRPRVRAELVDRLAAAGVPRIEAVSFVSPKARAADGRSGGGRRGDRAARRASSTRASR